MEKFLDRAFAGGVFETGGDADGEPPLKLDGGEGAGENERQRQWSRRYEAAVVPDVNDEGRKDFRVWDLRGICWAGQETAKPGFGGRSRGKGRSGASRDELRERREGGEMTDSAQPKSYLFEDESKSEIGRDLRDYLVNGVPRIQKCCCASFGNSLESMAGSVTTACLG